jgi:hypothetical protein
MLPSLPTLTPQAALAGHVAGTAVACTVPALAGGYDGPKNASGSASLMGLGPAVANGTKLAAITCLTTTLTGAFLASRGRFDAARTMGETAMQSFKRINIGDIKLANKLSWIPAGIAAYVDGKQTAEIATRNQT